MGVTPFAFSYGGWYWVNQLHRNTPVFRDRHLINDFQLLDRGRFGIEDCKALRVTLLLRTTYPFFPLRPRFWI